MLLLSNEDVQTILDMSLCLDALEAGYRDLLGEEAAYGAKFNFWVPQDDGDGSFRFSSMEGASRRLGVFAIRMKLDILQWPGEQTEERRADHLLHRRGNAGAAVRRGRRRRVSGSSRPRAGPAAPH